jgi:hypothetical protein
MGAVRDIVNQADSTSEITSEIKENLGLLMSLAEAKGKAYEKMIEADLRTGKTGDGLTIPITKVIQSRTEYRARTSSKLKNEIIGDVKDSMGKIFTGDGQILEGISGIITAALDAIMGAGEGQESEVTAYSVVAEYPAIVRFDFAFWGRNVFAQSIKAHMENVFTCVAYKSAVDISTLAFNDFLALYGPILNKAYGEDRDKLKQMIEQAREIYSLFKVDIYEKAPTKVALSTRRPPFKITTRPATEGNF